MTTNLNHSCFTSKEVTQSISHEGFKTGQGKFAYLTDKGNLSFLQAQIDIALPAIRPLPNAIIRIDVSGIDPYLINHFLLAELQLCLKQLFLVMNSELKIAFENLKETGSATIGDFRLELGDDDSLVVIGWSQYLNISNLTKQICVNELAEVKDNYLRMVAMSRELKEYAIGKKIEFNLYYDDGRKMSIVICSEKNGIIRWFVNLT